LSKHTPGPWSLKYPRNDNENGGSVRSVDGYQAKWIGTLRADTSEDDANARLIVAGPNLLAACQEAAEKLRADRDAFGISRPEQLLLNKLEAALAAVEGGGS